MPRESIRKALVMRNRRHRSGQKIQSYANNSNVNITNVTHITKVSNFIVSGTSGINGRPTKIGRHKKVRRNDLHGGCEIRPPKLQRLKGLIEGRPSLKKKVNCWKPKPKGMVISSRAP